MNQRYFSVITLTLIIAYGYGIDLDKLKRTLAKKPFSGATKGNSCPEDRPFPCKSKKCIPIKYLCDDNWDCEDGYDEDVEMCTAAYRIPVDQTIKMLDNEKWMMTKLFPGKNVVDVAYALAVTPTIEQFQEKMGLSDGEIAKIEDVLYAVENGEKKKLVSMGMSASSWTDIRTLVGKLIKSGFI